MQCTSCGTEAAVGATQCSQCGGRIGQVSTTGGGSEEKNWIMGAHLSGLVGFIGPLIIWLMKKDGGSPELVENAKEALNFQISCLIYQIAASASMALLIGLLLAPAVWLFWLVLTIMAAVKASNGEAYKYPLTIRLIK